MNEFIPLLWLADVVRVLQCAAACAIFIICGAAFFCCLESHVEEIPNKMLERKKLLILIVMASFLTFLLPHSETIQMYAALNATQDIAETQIGKKALAALEAKLDSIIEEGADQ